MGVAEAAVAILFSLKLGRRRILRVAVNYCEVRGTVVVIFPFVDFRRPSGLENAGKRSAVPASAMRRALARHEPRYPRHRQGSRS